MSTLNYYVVLGIAEDADGDMIRSAFRALARQYHPDAGAGSCATEFQRAREAYETLGDPERRRLYDRQLRAARVVPVIIKESIVSRPVAEPLFAARPGTFGFRSTRVSFTRSSFFDDLIAELFASFDGDSGWRRR
jgi:curved DNA-binding protein CbpA